MFPHIVMNASRNGVSSSKDFLPKQNKYIEINKEAYHSDKVADFLRGEKRKNG